MQSEREQTIDDLDRRVREAAAAFGDLAVVVLFGSRASGIARADSDLDVAVLTRRDALEARRRLQSRLASALADLIPNGRVDVVFVDEAPVLLRQELMETGRVVLCRDTALWRDWRVRTMRAAAHAPSSAAAAAGRREAQWSIRTCSRLARALWKATSLRPSRALAG